MHIRTLQSTDLDELLGLYAHLHDSDEPPPDREAPEAVWAEALENPKCAYLGGFEGAALVSSCTVLVIPNLTRGARPYALIENVVTHRDHRSKGYGKALLARALAFAWSLRCYKVMLMTGRKDEATRHFYQSAGFDGDAKQAFIVKSAN